MRVRLLAALAAAVLLMGGCSITPEEVQDDPTSVPRLNRLPDVTLTSLTDGPAVDVGALRGPLAVNIWASWCPPCERELPYYAAVAQKYAGRLDVLGVDYQDSNPDQAVAMMRKAKVSYPVVRDFDGEFRAISAPRLLLVDEAGRVVYDEYLEITSQAALENLVAKHLGVT